MMVMKRIMVFLFTALCSVALYAQDNKEAGTAPEKVHTETR